MKKENSKSWELSKKDLIKIAFLIGSFMAGFYFTNIDLVNDLIGQYVSPEKAGITTALVFYIFKQLVKDNTAK